MHRTFPGFSAPWYPGCPSFLLLNQQVPQQSDPPFGILLLSTSGRWSRPESDWQWFRMGYVWSVPYHLSLVNTCSDNFSKNRSDENNVFSRQRSGMYTWYHRDHRPLRFESSDEMVVLPITLWSDMQVKIDYWKIDERWWVTDCYSHMRDQSWHPQNRNFSSHHGYEVILPTLFFLNQ